MLNIGEKKFLSPFVKLENRRKGIILKKKALEWFIKIAWPIVKFVIINFGREITIFIFEKIKSTVRRKRTAKMEEALNKAKNVENAAEETNNPEEKLRYYEIAKAYKDEAEYQRRFLNDFLEEIENAALEIMETVQQKSSEVEVDDLFTFDKKKGTLKAAENRKLLEHKSDKKNKK